MPSKPRASPRAPPPRDPRFRIENMDRRVDPTVDFYRYAAGGWIDRNPVPSDKSRWGGFGELQEHNFRRLHEILETCAHDRNARGDPVAQQVGAFYASALDHRQRERRGFAPVLAEIRRIEKVRSLRSWFRAVAEVERRGGDGVFATFVMPDDRESSTYALYLFQGGLSLPDRDYYLTEPFAPQREAYRGHVARMLRMLGDPPARAKAAADTILSIETELAKASRSRTELRDPEKNYHRFTVAKLETAAPSVPWRAYLAGRGIGRPERLVVGQPEFLRSLDRLLRQRPLADWVTYLRWRVLRRAAPYLHRRAEKADFDFYHRALLGQPKEEPDWKRAAIEIDQSIGEALGKLYVERHFPPEARARVQALVEHLKEVFRNRLAQLDWMTEATRRRALAKFDRFTTKIGHPEKFRDYRKVRVDRRDYFGNVARAARFEVDRQIARIGRPVDRSEWHMTPPEVNAYFNPNQNEIVFPAGILQPPFFDVRMDEAVNYGAIGAVIGHEITHGYDDQGRKFDANGNLRDWWTPADAKEFTRRAERIVTQYGKFEALPKTPVNGALTMGENIADLGGVSLAFEALERHLAVHPEERTPVDGLTPEQRFFLSYGQVWRENIREADLRRRITIDPHSPGRFRVIGPLANLPEFAATFQVPERSPMRQREADRVAIW